MGRSIAEMSVEKAGAIVLEAIGSRKVVNVVQYEEGKRPR